MILMMLCMFCFLVDVAKDLSPCGNTLNAWYKVVQLYVLCHSEPDLSDLNFLKRIPSALLLLLTSSNYLEIRFLCSSSN